MWLFLLPPLHAAQLARKLYECMRKEAASIRIQKHVRAHTDRKSYTKLVASAIVIQTGLRAMAARNEYRYRRRTKATTSIQVINPLAGIKYTRLHRETFEMEIIWHLNNSRSRIFLEQKQHFLFNFMVLVAVHLERQDVSSFKKIIHN